MLGEYMEQVKWTIYELMGNIECRASKEEKAGVHSSRM